MLISVSFLSAKNDVKQCINKLSKTSVDYLHLDIMDGQFVSNKTWNVNEMKYLLEDTTKPLDIHLMVCDVYKYIDDFKILNPSYITIHYEINEDLVKVIDYIHANGIKAGISIKPSTNIEELNPYLGIVDLVLIMSVEPGYGGQSFIETTIDKIKVLKQKQGKYLISVDGGINDKTIELIDADMCVVGSYILSSDDYQNNIDKLKI